MTEWQLKHAEMHGQLNATLRSIDKNMDELADKYDYITKCHYACREEVLKKLVELKVLARAEARDEAKQWTLKVVTISAILGFIGGLAIMGISLLLNTLS